MFLNRNDDIDDSNFNEENYSGKKFNIPKLPLIIIV